MLLARTQAPYPSGTIRLCDYDTVAKSDKHKKNGFYLSNSVRTEWLARWPVRKADAAMPETPRGARVPVLRRVRGRARSLDRVSARTRWLGMLQHTQTHTRNNHNHNDNTALTM